MLKKSIIILNAFFILGSIYALYEDYRRVGRFQWTDPDAVEDNEELYLNPIFVVTIILGLISILNYIPAKTDRDKGSVLNFLKKFISIPLCLLYGTFASLVGIVFLAMLAGNLGNNPINDFNDFIFLLLLFLIFGGYAFMGILTLYLVYFDINSS